MASAETTTLAQAVDLLPRTELRALLEVGTLREAAEEAARRLLVAGHMPWWPLDRRDGAWAALAGLDDVVLLRAPIAELGRYYDGVRAIVLREDLPAEQEQAVLWHEVLHARRRDTAAALTQQEHDTIDREAYLRATPTGELVAELQARQATSRG